MCVVCFMHVCLLVCLFVRCQYQNCKLFRGKKCSAQQQRIIDRIKKRKIKANLTSCENIQPRLSNSNINSSGWWQATQTYLVGLYLLRFDVDLYKILLYRFEIDQRFVLSKVKTKQREVNIFIDEKQKWKHARIFFLMNKRFFQFAFTKPHCTRFCVSLCIGCPPIFYLNSFLSV